MEFNYEQQRITKLPDQQSQQLTNLDSAFATSLHREYNDDNRVVDGNNQQQAADNFPDCIIEDNPGPAVFIARKLLSDFVKSVDKKAEAILSQDKRDRPIFRSLERNEDVVYDQILEALGAISEYCLPSLLRILISWYHHQLSIDEKQRPLQSPESAQQQQQQCDENHPPSDCGSPCNNNLASISSVVRSPTPSCPETPTPSMTSASNNNQTISIASTLPLDYQSPSSLTVIGTTGDLHLSVADTSNSTATNASSNSLIEDSASSIKRIELFRARKLLIEYSLCQALIEIFNQLYLHPGHDDLIGQIENIAFEHFRYVEGNESNPDVNQLAEKFAKVIGVLARTRFTSVRKRFITELNELKIKDPTPFNIQCIATLLSGMKFFRIKMAPIEEFEASLKFLQECAEYFLEVRHKSIKYALAGLFVEILVPFASSVKNEVKIPCLKNFVDTLWAQTLDMCSRKKYSIILFPLVTCLLCISQRSFFLTNWTVFLNMCLSNLKNRDQKMRRVALESLYRLIWIYMIRLKCESNNITQNRLHSIVEALFPRGGRAVVLRDAPLATFVHIIQFIAQERLDFAMRQIVFDLLSIDRPFKVIISPERMNIGIQAYLAIADSLQQKDGELPLPKLAGLGSIISGSAPVSRRPHVNKMINDEVAKSIGIYSYYSHIQKSFNEILKALDAQYGRPLMLTTIHGTNKEPDDIITSEQRPKIELFKTCLAAIPRLMPEGMPRADLIDLLSRMTIHVDEDLRKLAIESLEILMTENAEWRLEAVEGFTSFLVKQIDDSHRNFVDDALSTLLQFLLCWKNAIAPSPSRTGSVARPQNGQDSDTDCNLEDDFTTSVVFWMAVIMLESDIEEEYTLALRLLKRMLPNLPFEQPEFVEEMEKSLTEMRWDDFPGIHPLVLKGSLSSSTYDLSIAILDIMTPILNQPICCDNKQDTYFPFHIIVLLTYLLSTYDDPKPYSLNIARRIAIWCDENSRKFDNLSTVMTLYSRRCFSKGQSQWLKCVIKYLFDAYPKQLPTVIPHLVDMLEKCPLKIQKLIAPILYCIFNYVDINSAIINNDLARIYIKYLGDVQWPEAVKIFKLIISRSSHLAYNGASYSRELPGRTMDFALDVESIMNERPAPQPIKAHGVEKEVARRWKWVLVRVPSDES